MYKLLCILRKGTLKYLKISLEKGEISYIKIILNIKTTLEYQNFYSIAHHFYTDNEKNDLNILRIRVTYNFITFYLYFIIITIW